jgi:hypothetical protein
MSSILTNVGAMQALQSLSLATGALVVGVAHFGKNADVARKSACATSLVQHFVVNL